MSDPNRMRKVVAKIIQPVVSGFKGIKDPGQAKLFIHVIKAGADVMDAAEIFIIRDIIDKIIVKSKCHQRGKLVSHSHTHNLRQQVILAQVSVDCHVHIVNPTHRQFIGESVFERTGCGPIKNMVVFLSEER